MEPDFALDEALILTMLSPQVARLLKKSIRKESYRQYVRDVILEQLEDDYTNTKDYLLENMKTQNIPYWIYTEKKEYWAEGEDEYEQYFINTIGSTFSSLATVFTGSLYEEPYSNSVEVSVVELVYDQDLYSILLGYATTYMMQIEYNKDTDLFDENPYIFKDELKSAILARLDSYYQINPNTDQLYEWFYCNCISLGIDVKYDSRLIEEDSDELKQKTDELYVLLRSKLIEVLTVE
jgi:hypothetical protein